jgi:hypothetical protein
VRVSALKTRRDTEVPASVSEEECRLIPIVYGNDKVLIAIEIMQTKELRQMPRVSIASTVEASRPVPEPNRYPGPDTGYREVLDAIFVEVRHFRDKKLRNAE